MTENLDFLGEGEVTETNTEVPAGEATETEKDDRVFEVDGVAVSKSEFIRHQFTDNNLSRKEISEKFDINYRTVYGATVNMVNEAEPTARGRATTNAKIDVTTDGQVVTEADGVTYVNGEELEAGAPVPETTSVERNTWIKEQVEAGKSRSDIANVLGLSYGVVYGLTKDVAGASQRHEIEYEGEVISRSEYIRKLHAKGMSKGEIAKELGVDYPVVWSALKGLKSEQEKFQDAVKRLEKFAAHTEDEGKFMKALEKLAGTAFKAENEDAPEESTEEPIVAE